MERDAVSFAIKHDRAEAEWCDRMSGRKHFAAVFLDRIEGLVETAMRIEVNQRSTFRRSGVDVEYEAATDGTLGMRQHSHRRARSGLLLLQFCSQDSGVEAHCAIEIANGDVEPHHLMPHGRRLDASRGFYLQWRGHSYRRRWHHLRYGRWSHRCHGCRGHLRCASLGLGRRTLLLAAHRPGLCRRLPPQLRWRLIPHVPAILLYLTSECAGIDGESQRSPGRQFHALKEFPPS